MLKLTSKKHPVKFDTQAVFKGHHNITYRGIKAIKCPFDYVIYQMLIWQIQPDLIIEIGTNKGGTALYFADLLSIIGKGEVHTIDIIKGQADPQLADNPRIRLFTDGFKNYDRNLASKFETILVIEDGSHTYDDSIEALKLFSPLVTKDSYYIVEDGIVNELGIVKEFNGGPLKAIDEFMATTDEFVIDRTCCDMFGVNATFNVDGYLKRVK